MGLGVLEDTRLPHVPGTVLLNDQSAHSEDVTAALKHGTGRDAHIVLSPQPSEDPNDPLNWPLWRRELMIWILCLGALLCAGTNGPLLNASYYPMSIELGVPITKVVLASGYNILGTGCIGPFVCAFSRKWGKRPVFMASTLICIVGTAIGQAKISYEYLLAARIVQGFSTSAFESLIVSAVGDLYFVHQRGLRIAIINFILNAASSLSSIICGQVYANLGYKWLFHLFQIFLVIQFVLMFLFCPECTYIRDVRYETDIIQDDKLGELANIEEAKREQIAHVEETEMRQTESKTTTPAVSMPLIPKKKTFVQSLAIYTGSYSGWSVLFKSVLGPFITLLNPAAFYADLTSGLLCAWYVGSAIILSGIFSAPPYNFNAAQVGYLGAGPFVGGMLGSIVVGFAADPVIKYMTIRNHGVYEPEFRLVFMIIAAPCMGLGMFLFGYTMAIGAAAELCAFLQGLMMFGSVIGIFSSLSYGLDAFRNQSTELFMMNMVFKNFMFYGLSNFANNWVEDQGPEPVMYVFGGTALFVAIMGLPVYIWGKKLRSYWARHDLFEKFNMYSTGPQEIAG